MDVVDSVIGSTCAEAEKGPHHEKVSCVSLCCRYTCTMGTFCLLCACESTAVRSSTARLVTVTADTSFLLSSEVRISGKTAAVAGSIAIKLTSIHPVQGGGGGRGERWEVKGWEGGKGGEGREGM